MRRRLTHSCPLWGKQASHGLARAQFINYQKGLWPVHRKFWTGSHVKLISIYIDVYWWKGSCCLPYIGQLPGLVSYKLYANPILSSRTYYDLLVESPTWTSSQAHTHIDVTRVARFLLSLHLISTHKALGYIYKL